MPRPPTRTYITLWNGGTPFRVVVQPDQGQARTGQVTVYRVPPDDDGELEMAWHAKLTATQRRKYRRQHWYQQVRAMVDSTHSHLVGRYRFKRCWAGQWRTGPRQRVNRQWTGSAVLVHTHGRHYRLWAENAYEFELPSRYGSITHFFSQIGHSAVTMVSALTRTHTICFEGAVMYILPRSKLRRFWKQHPDRRISHDDSGVFKLDDSIDPWWCPFIYLEPHPDLSQNQADTLQMDVH